MAFLICVLLKINSRVSTMKYLKIILIFFAFQMCMSQENEQFYSKEFNWRMAIPEDFKSVSTQEWATMQNKGETVLEDTFGGEIANNAKTIVVFKSDELNYFEANFQPFDSATDGDYLESFKYVSALLYETFKSQMPDVKLDSVSSRMKINRLKFEVFKLKVTYPNQTVMHFEMYSRLFDKREFTVNIIYADEKKGAAMAKLWKASKFE